MNDRRRLRWLAALLVPLLAACNSAPQISSPPTVAASPTAVTAEPAATAPPSATQFTIGIGGAPNVAPAPTPPIATLALPANFTPAFDGARAFADAAQQMQWQPRNTGTPGWQKTGDYIIEQVEAAGWLVEEQRFTYNGVECRNIIAKRGLGPAVVLGAHYDARLRADMDTDPAKRTQVVPAANDGASGVAVLLELARVLQPETSNHAVWLAFFDAEDNGELDGWEWTVGSRYMATHLAERPLAVVVVDMIGDRNLNIHYEGNSDPALRELIWGAAQQLGLAQFSPTIKYSMEDDHTPFLQQGLPAVDLIDFDYPAWHTTGDTLDQIAPESLQAVGQTLELWLASGAVWQHAASTAVPADQPTAPSAPSATPAQ